MPRIVVHRMWSGTKDAAGHQHHGAVLRGWIRTSRSCCAARRGRPLCGGSQGGLRVGDDSARLCSPGAAGRAGEPRPSATVDAIRGRRARRRGPGPATATWCHEGGPTAGAEGWSNEVRLALHRSAPARCRARNRATPGLADDGTRPSQSGSPDGLVRWLSSRKWPPYSRWISHSDGLATAREIQGRDRVVLTQTATKRAHGSTGSTRSALGRRRAGWA